MKISRPPSSPPTSPTATPRPATPEPVTPKPSSAPIPSDVFDGPVGTSNLPDRKQGPSGSSIRGGAGASSSGQGIEDRDKFKASRGPGGCGGQGTTASGSSIRAGGRGNSGGTQGEPPGTKPFRPD